MLEINNLTWNIGKGKVPDGEFGETVFRNLSIFISDELVDEALIKTTIIHEMTHAFLFSYGFYLVGSGANMNEEQICDFIAMNGPTILDLSRRAYEELYPANRASKKAKNKPAGTRNK